MHTCVRGIDYAYFYDFYYCSYGHFSFSLHYILCIFQDIVAHWLIAENVDGFYIRNSAYMYEDYDMRNETKSNISDTNEVLYFYTPFARCSILRILHCVLWLIACLIALFL